MCIRDRPELCARGAVALLVVNPTAAELRLELGAVQSGAAQSQPRAPPRGASVPSALPRLEYSLTSVDIESPSAALALNGAPLDVGPGGELPELAPRIVRDAPDARIGVGPLSVSFFVLPAGEGGACARAES